MDIHAFSPLCAYICAPKLSLGILPTWNVRNRLCQNSTTHQPFGRRVCRNHVLLSDQWLHSTKYFSHTLRDEVSNTSVVSSTVSSVPKSLLANPSSLHAMKRRTELSAPHGNFNTVKDRERSFPLLPRHETMSLFTERRSLNVQHRGSDYHYLPVRNHVVNCNGTQATFQSQQRLKHCPKCSFILLRCRHMKRLLNCGTPWTQFWRVRSWWSGKWICKKRFPTYHVCPKCLAARLCGTAIRKNASTLLQVSDEEGMSLVDS